MPLVLWRIDVDVRKDMFHCHADLDAGDLGSPEEIPVLVHFEIFIPANRLQDIAIGYEAITNECTLGNVANASISST